MAATDARPIPRRAVAYRHYFDIRKTDNTLITTWADMDSEVSKDGGNFADCTNEATEIQTTGTGFLDLTAAEMTADCVVIKVAVSNSGAVPYVATIYPAQAGDYPEIADDVWDEVLTAAAHNVANSAGRRLRQLQVGGNYEDGAIWIDTTNGTAGTTVDENGTVTNPVDSLADAATISGSNNLKILCFYPGSSVTLAAGLAGYVIRGIDTEIALGGQSVSGSVFYDCEVSGVCTGASVPEFYGCDFGNATLPPSVMRNCTFGGTLTLGSAGDFELIDCCSVVAGSSTPVIDFGAGVGATTMSIRRWSGGLTFQNIKAGDIISLEGTGGTVTVGGTGGSIYIRGIFNAIVDSSSGTVTIGDNACLNRSELASSIAGPGASTVVLTITKPDTTPISDVQVWVSTDAAGSNVVAGAVLTDAAGQATFYLDAGTYYRWAQKSGYNFTNPQTFTVT